MSDVFVTNYTLEGANNAFSAIWKLTRALKKAGWTYKSSGDGGVGSAPEHKDITGQPENDKWGGNTDPLLDPYPTSLDGTSAWWNAQGPTTLKVSMSSAPSGTFIRGETVSQVQALNNAEGEFLGYDFDAGGGMGHAVILPRVGTFDTSSDITGESSGASFTPTDIKTFVMEIVFVRSASYATYGGIYLQRVCAETENESRFSYLAEHATGCTAAYAPGGGNGGGGTGNGFPTVGSYYGCGGTLLMPWFQVMGNLGKAQIVATNCTGSAGSSSDGSFWILIGDMSSPTQAQFFSYMRTDGGEAGDLDPFVWCKPSNIAYNNPNVRLDASGSNSLSGTSLLTGAQPSTVAWRGWRRRGFSSEDSFVPLTTSGLAYLAQTYSVPLMADSGSTETVACSYSNKRVRDQFLIVSADGMKKIRKGYPRWMWTIMGGTTFDTWDDRTKVCIIPAGTGTPATPPVIVGPYDGVTTPVQG